MLEKIIPDLQHMFKELNLQTALIDINQKTNLRLGLMAACVSEIDNDPLNVSSFPEGDLCDMLIKPLWVFALTKRINCCFLTVTTVFMLCRLPSVCPGFCSGSFLVW